MQIPGFTAMGFVKESSSGSRVMFKNYLKIAFRTIRKHKGYSLINILGLSLGMAICILILLWVQHELSYDRFHENRDFLYRIYQDYHHAGGISQFSNVPQPVGPEIQNTIPEVEFVTRYLDDEFTFRYEEKLFTEKNVCYIDPSFFRMFSFAIVKGDAEAAFLDPYSIILTETMAEKYFGNEDPIGKILTADNQYQMKVTAIVEDVPDNSFLQFNFLVPYCYLEAIDYDVTNWNSHNCQIYVLLHRNIDYKQVEDKIYGMIKKHAPDDESYLRLQPLRHTRLYTLGGELGSIKYVYIFSIIALFILVIACINFMNLATARSGRRAREVGLRKVVGARRIQIIRQFFGESIVLTIVALGFSLLIVEVLLPVFNSLSGKNLHLNSSGNLAIFASLLGIALFTGLLSGSYPALFLSSFLPGKVLKSTYRSSSRGSILRKVLVVFQFSLSIFLIISTMVIYSQLQYIQSKDLGFNNENLIYAGINERIKENYDAIKNEILKNPHISNMTRTFQLPSYNRYSAPVNWEGKTPDQNINFNISLVDPDYLDTLNLQLVQGRNFSYEFSTDTSNYILNQEAVKQMGLESPIGKWLEHGEKGKIIGVVRNYHYMPFTYAIEPLILYYNPSYFRYTMLRISGNNIPQTLSFLENIWGKFAPEFPFEYHFLDEDYERIYRTEQRLGELFRYFTFLAIFISCLGLFGLASFMAEQRTKEIGIRKVLGATVSSVTLLLSKEYTKWLLLANIIAWPMAYFAMHKWLEGFAYRVGVSVFTFVLAGSLTLFIALLTVSYQAIKASVANPVEALRHE
jgi:putative ABC transport system permease protein